MKHLISFLFIGIYLVSNAQNASLSGKVIENYTEQVVVGAKITLLPSSENADIYRALSNSDGDFVFKEIVPDKYIAMVTMLSFDTLIVDLELNQGSNTYDFIIGGSQELEEVKVIGNLVQDRKTPVAVTRISTKQLSEELGSRDLPMILNSSPGVYATQQGGGDGDARITIRGFSQRNVGVMIDGVPVNDMENGWVYWSNWFGLDAITGQIQLQRGLGATKLAMPSVGGTMNIITQATGGKRMIKVGQEYGSGDFLRTSLSYKSGTLKNGWGILFSGSYKQGNGWVDGLNTLGAFYYLKVQKKIKNHILSLSGFGAPQNHGQRSYNQPIAYWDSEFAGNMGISVNDTMSNIDYGRRHNQHWGYYTDSISGKRSIINERMNFYHKPQITLKDFWKVNDKLSWSNLAYLSIGTGGGQRARNTGALIRDSLGQIDWNAIEYNNKYKILFGQVYSTADPLYDSVLFKSSQVLTASMNNHFWIGGLSQFDYQANDDWMISGGLDYRYYRGEHYVEVRDLLGGDYWVNDANLNSSNPMKIVGDKVGWYDYHNHRHGFVQWAGGFGQAEYSKGRWTAFVNVSGVANGYKGVDYFMKKEMVLSDTTLYIGATDTVSYNGQTYTNSSEGLTYNQTPWKWLGGFTLKSGANYNITEKSNVFVNLGFLNRTPQYSNVIDNNTNTFFEEVLNEKIYATEVGYGYRSKKFSMNINTYFTMWENKPFPYGVSVPDPQDPTVFVRANVNGMDALHLGGEMDFVYYISPKLNVEGMISYGDWTWQSAETINVLGTEFTFDAKDVHVGDAAQAVYAISTRYEFVKNAYLKIKYTYFSKNYSNFDPFSLTGENGGTESWQLPDYGLMSAHAGYRIYLDNSILFFKANVFNALNSFYISDGRNNQNGSSFDATSAGVFIGQGIRFNFSLGFQF